MLDPVAAKGAWWTRLTAEQRRFVQFLFVGAANTAFGYGVYFAVLRAGVEPIAALALATVAGILFNFASTGTFVFGSRDPRKLVRFVTVYCVLFVINVGLLRLLLAAGVGAALAQAMLLLPMALASFLALRFFVFAGSR